MSAARRSFGTREDLAIALAEAVAEQLMIGIEAHGHGAMAVSGGSTPGRFFDALALRDDVDWSKVTVTLVDERWVPESSERSNAALVKGRLLRGPASKAHFVPLYAGGEAPDEVGLKRTALQLQALPARLDAVVLGMGNDGHTASFFPGGDRLEEALEGHDAVVAIRAPGAGEPRVTLTLGRLLAAEAMYLHIEGEEKLATLERALGDGDREDMPVRAVLRQGVVPLTIFWSP